MFVLFIRLWDVLEVYCVFLKFSVVKMRGSGFYCDCNVCWLKVWLFERKLDDIICVIFVYLMGIMVIKLRDSDFVCGECL